MKSIIFQISILSGTIIGAGVFALPFVFQQAGLVAGFFYLLAAGIAYIFINLMYADLVLRISDEHRFVGYAQKYLGQWSFWPTIVMTVMQMIIVLAVYLILSQSFSRLIGGSGLMPMLIFWIVGSWIIFAGLQRLVWLEFLAISGILAIILLIFFFSLMRGGHINAELFTGYKNLLLPLAPILFALSGRVAIPSLIRYSMAGLKASIIIGTLIPVVVYGLFVISILRLSVNGIMPDAISGLVGFVPKWLLIAIGLFGLLSLLSSYIAVGFDVYESILKDLRLSKWLGFMIVALGPLAVYFWSSQTFLTLVGIVGGIFLALESLMIVAMWLRANKLWHEPSRLLPRAHPLITLAILVLFATALIYEIIKLKL